MDHLTSFVGECDRKTEAAKKRLAETQEELSAEVAAKAQKVCFLLMQMQKSRRKQKFALGSCICRTNRTKACQSRRAGR